MLSDAGPAMDNMSLEQIEEMIARELESKKMKKVVEDERLDFKEQEGSPYLDIVENAYKEGKLLSFIVNESERYPKSCKLSLQV